MKHQNQVNKLALCLLAAALAISCETINKKLVEVFADNKEPAPLTWKINAINLEERMFYLGLKEKLPDTLIMLGSKYNIQILEQNQNLPDGTPYLFCDLWIREKTYTKGLNTINSITALLSLTDPATKKVVVRALYTEESEETLKSYQHLYTILEELFRNIQSQVRFRPSS
jgi:hypothetical protein